MSDNWKSLLNQFGIPGPADPPEVEKKPTDPPIAAKPVAADDQPKTFPPAKDVPTPAQVSSEKVEPSSPRRRVSMWGDELAEEKPLDAELPPTPAAAKPPAPRPAAPPTPPAEPDRAADPLREIAASKREAPVPGFDVPPVEATESNKPPAKRSAWDTLIGTLGLKSAPPSAAESFPETIDAPAAASRGRESTRDFGSSSRGSEERRGPRSEEAPSRGFAEGLIEGEETEPSRRSPPRGEPRSRTVARDRDDLEPPTTRTPRSDVSESPPAAIIRGLAGDDELPQPRRSRRRGQRQRLAGDAIEPDVAESTERPRRSEEPEADDSAFGAENRREEAPRRGRGPRERSERDRERPDRPRGERERPDRSAGADGRRPERRSVSDAPPTARRRPSEATRNEREDQAPVDDDFGGGFGEGLLDDSDVDSQLESQSRETDSEERRRPRRRRGRRGRGGAAARETGPETGDATPASESYESPGFDDDLEDDDEVDQIRRRARGGRGPGSSAEGSARDDRPVRDDRPPRDRKARDIPNWVDTIGLLVDANINRRNSGGSGGGGSRSPQGRGGRRS
ncbi:MAG: hypothetical protein EA381_21085 [Planctomycetaceae bacterium]|nr:MAG: hypothetical protein EA381_21085 [Planctomycetaceae bacterium]